MEAKRICPSCGLSYYTTLGKCDVCRAMGLTAITGDLTVLREYSCGCLIYLDEVGQEVNERGIFCGQGPWYKHRDLLVRGQETQPSLFAAGQ
jgi:hypothetical protein